MQQKLQITAGVSVCTKQTVESLVKIVPYKTEAVTKMKSIRERNTLLAEDVNALAD
jgi:hypothetical protein